ncbi:hypothetical protein RN001_010305 [Aquatica leii]|uniref:Max-binding protein MNT n=1 Tax=Aquatica leii TaxID=1421715 RepID=A0AAN7SFZ2_9COLE|nr:hypothetical protein RN001_010305 [Aquatica leii]
MSLDTLLEAARYLELQELKEQQQRQAVAPVPAQPPPPLHPQPVTIIKPVPDPPPLQQTPLTHNQRIIQNSFDIINPLVIDEGGEQKRKQPPLVFRSGTREVHNKLEKHRRAHLKECFDFLKKQLPAQADEKKTSNLSILHSALRYIQSLKRKERELEHEMERLAREKIAAQQRLAVLKKEIAVQCDNIDFNVLLPEQAPTVTIESKLTSPATVERIKPLPNGVKESPVVAQQQVQATALSVVPMAGYPVSQSIVLHKVALVPKGIADLSPLTAVSSPVAHFITAPTQQLNGKVLPVVNAQYVVKPVVVVSSQPSVAPRPS